MGGRERLSFLAHTLWVFIALRLADAVNIASGLWFVPKYVSADDIGAVLPLSSFATFLSLPLFAFAMTAMKEAVHLSASGEKARLKSLLLGVFVAAGITIALGLGIAGVIMPVFMKRIGVCSNSVGFMVIGAAFLGCVAPVYTDALQATKRFKALGVIEVVSSVARFSIMLILMPFRALFGYFSAQAMQPLMRILISVLALRRELGIKSESYWSKEVSKRFLRSFLLILVYQAVPMAVSLLEQYIIRTSMGVQDSAGYYLASRFSDFLFYLTFPLLIVSFPYTALARDGSSRMKYVLICSSITLFAAFLAAIAYVLWGAELLSILPNGVKYSEYSFLMPHLVIITAFTSVQVFVTNAEVSAGKFGFFIWYLPLHAVYAVTFAVANSLGLIESSSDIIPWFWALALFRILFSLGYKIKVKYDII